MSRNKINESNCFSKEESVQDRCVCLEWDGEAAIWIATSEEIPGLVLEDLDYSSLLHRVSTAQQELQEFNESARRC